MKYNRVVAATTSQGNGSDDNLESHLDVENDRTTSVEPTKVPLQDAQSPGVGRTSRLVRRGNSQRSLGSGQGLVRIRSGEESLPGSFDKEEGIRKNGEIVIQIGPGSLDIQPAAYPTISTLYKASSFELDEDDEDVDDMGMQMHRYEVEFSTTEKGHALTNAMHGSFSSINGRSPRSLPSSICRWLWHSFQSARQKARERRAELLLQQTEQTCQKSSWIFILTLCDATDRGILLVAGILIAWIVAIVLVKTPATRLRIIIGGIVFLVLRLGTRPLISYCSNQRMKRRQSSLQPIQQNPSPFRCSSLSSMAATDAVPGASSYLSRRMNERKTDNDETELPVIRSKSSMENLPPALECTDSNGSDPTIAAI
jgi:hypothetical protein